MKIGMGGLHSDLPQDWELAKLDEVAERATGHTPDKTIPSYWDGGIKWVSLADSNKLDQQYITTTDKEISAEGIRKSSANLLPSGTVVLLRDAAVGRSTILATEMAVSQHFVAWTCGKRICNRYLYYHFQLRKPFFERMAVGSTIVTIGMELFRKLMVPLPSKGEQECIAVTLETWDRSIDLTERLIAAKQERRTWLMQQLLTGRRRLPGCDGKWQKVHLRDIFMRVQRSIPEGETPEVLSITAKVGFVSQREKFSKVIAGKNIEQYVLIRRGEFSYNKGNSLTYPQGCVFRLKEFEEGAVPNVFLSFRAASPEICPDFYSHFFASGGLNHQLSRVINTGVRNDGLLNLNARDFFNVKVPFPPLVEQEQIAKTLSIANEELDLLRAQLDALREQKKGLMQQLLTGKVRVKIVC